MLGNSHADPHRLMQWLVYPVQGAPNLYLVLDPRTGVQSWICSPAPPQARVVAPSRFTRDFPPSFRAQNRSRSLSPGRRGRLQHTYGRVDVMPDDSKLFRKKSIQAADGGGTRSLIPAALIHSHSSPAEHPTESKVPEKESHYGSPRESPTEHAAQLQTEDNLQAEDELNTESKHLEERSAPVRGMETPADEDVPTERTRAPRKSKAHIDKPRTTPVSRDLSQQRRRKKIHASNLERMKQKVPRPRSSEHFSRGSKVQPYLASRTPSSVCESTQTREPSSNKQKIWIRRGSKGPLSDTAPGKSVTLPLKSAEAMERESSTTGIMLEDYAQMPPGISGGTRRRHSESRSLDDGKKRNPERHHASQPKASDRTNADRRSIDTEPKSKSKKARPREFTKSRSHRDVHIAATDRSNTLCSGARESTEESSSQRGVPHKAKREGRAKLDSNDYGRPSRPRKPKTEVGQIRTKHRHPEADLTKQKTQLSSQPMKSSGNYTKAVAVYRRRFSPVPCSPTSTTTDIPNAA